MTAALLAALAALELPLLVLLAVMQLAHWKGCD